jgi:hypothetical protein
MRRRSVGTTNYMEKTLVSVLTEWSGPLRTRVALYPTTTKNQ